MTREQIRADRHATVRGAARDWQAAGVVDAPTLAAIERAYPDDRHRLGLVFRVLAFGFTWLAIGAAFAFAALVTGLHDASGAAALTLILGLGLWVATEILKGPLRLVEAGVEAATALAAVGFLAASAGFFLFEVVGVGEALALRLTLTAAIALCATLVWRFGSAAGAAIALVLLGVLLAQFPGGRWSWMAAALVLIPLALRGSESPSLPPAQRDACAGALIVALAGLYVALHILSWDLRVFERDLSRIVMDPPSWNRAPSRRLFMLTTGLVPLAVIAYGLRARRRPVLAAGLLFGVASLATVRFYVHVAPLWVILCASGGGLIALALITRRWLASGPSGERAGWTERDLLSEGARDRVVEMAVGVLAATPESATREPGFEGGGGRSGGGGASTEF